LLETRRGLSFFLAGATVLLAGWAPSGPAEETVVLESDGWRLVGDLVLPPGDVPTPAVLLLNQAAGERTVYAALAARLVERGIASLRLDLRGHGESTNLGRFVPGDPEARKHIGAADADVVVAVGYLADHPAIDGARLAVVGASYSGEGVAEAGRTHGYAHAYVVLSPGSFRGESIGGIDASGVPWLFVSARADPYLTAITATVAARSQTVEMISLPGSAHGTDVLQVHPDLAERLAAWLEARLGD